MLLRSLRELGVTRTASEWPVFLHGSLGQFRGMNGAMGVQHAHSRFMALLVDFKKVGRQVAGVVAQHDLIFGMR